MRTRNLYYFIGTPILLVVGVFAYTMTDFAQGVADDTRIRQSQYAELMTQVSFMGTVLTKSNEPFGDDTLYQVRLDLKSISRINELQFDEVKKYPYYNFSSGKYFEFAVPERVYNVIEVGDLLDKLEGDKSIRIKTDSGFQYVPWIE